jgi:hypothetical protein
VVDGLGFGLGTHHCQARQAHFPDECSGFLVKEILVSFEDVRDSYRHRAINESPQVGDFVFFEELCEEVDEFLCSLDGEGWDDDVAFSPCCLVDDRSELSRDVFLWSVRPVAVCRFADDIVGLSDGAWVFENGHVMTSHVSREDDGSGFISDCDGEFKECRSQYVSGADEFDG